MYVLDTNIFIAAATDYYRFVFHSHFWDWLLEQHDKGNLCSIPRVRDELTCGGDKVSEWAKRNKEFFKCPPLPSEEIGRVTEYVTNTFNSKEKHGAVNSFVGGADLFLIAYALKYGWKIVTFEKFAGGGMPKVPKIPNVCEHFGVGFARPFDVWEELGLSL